MTTITDSAEECENKAYPTAIDFTDIPKTAHKLNGAGSGEEKVKSAIPQQAKDKAHSFCPILAKEHGEEAAVLIQGLGYKIAKSKKIRNGRKWHYDTLETLAEKWPYLTDSGIHGILQRQADLGNVLKDSFNRANYDRTTWYSMKDELVKRAMNEEGKVWFDVPAAVHCHSIIAGTLYQNIRYHLLLIRAENPEFSSIPFYRVNKSALARVLPWSLSTIKRAFIDLLEKKLIQENPNQAGEYTICNNADLIVPEGMKKFPSKIGSTTEKIGSSMEMGIGSSTERTGSSTEQSGSSTDEIGSSAENNTHLKPFERPFENHHLPTAPPCVGECSSKPADAGRESIVQANDESTGSTTVPVKEGVLSSMPKTLDEVRACIKELSGNLSAIEYLTLFESCPRLSIDFVKAVPLFKDLMTALNSSNTDEIITALAPSLFRATFNRGLDELNESARKLQFYQCMELTTGAFYLLNMKTSVVREQFKDVWDDVKTVMAAIPYPGYHKDSPPEFKVELLMLAIRKSNKDGWSTSSMEIFPFTISDDVTVEKAAAPFFKSNPDISVDDVLDALGECIDVVVSEPVTRGFDNFFDARRGVSPKYLLTYWTKVKAQLCVKQFQG